MNKCILCNTLHELETRCDGCGIQICRYAKQCDECGTINELAEATTTEVI